MKNGGEGNIIKKYLLRLVRLFGVWMIIYSPLLVIRPILLSHGSVVEMIKILQEILFKTPAYLWYLVALMAAGLLLYWFRKRLKGFLILSIVLYIVGAMGNTYIRILGLEELYSGYFRIFLTTRNGVFFAPVFVCLGAMLSEYGDKMKKSSHPVIMEAVALVVYILEVTLVSAGGRVYEDRSFYFSLPLVVVGLVWLLLRVERETLAASKCRKLSTWVYCSQFGFLTVFQIVSVKLSGSTVDGWILWLLVILAGTIVYLVLDSNKYSRKLLNILI